ncbi:chloride channel protein C-like [Petromyzon marinus]|uniref:chloride channel protein C-like n=1 Tax=Petromyzon marinus TaxID=7757 RepID=UPI003F6E940A
MLAVMVSKAVGDRFTRPLYHALLDQKQTPYLDSEPRVIFNKREVNLELLTAGAAMSRGVRILAVRESVANIARLLLDAPHGAYPVVRAPPRDEEEEEGEEEDGEEVDGKEEARGGRGCRGKEVFFGTITR